MRECEQALEWISARIDGCLTPEEEARLDAHLEHCPACQSLLADLELIHGELGEMAAAPAPIPASLREDIMDQVRAARPAHRAAPPHWRTWAAAAAVLAVVLLGAGPLQIWRNGGSGATTANLAADVGSSGGAEAGGGSAAFTSDTGDTGGDSLPAATPNEAGGDETTKQVVVSPVPPDTAVSSEEGNRGGATPTAAPTPPSYQAQAQPSSPPAGGSQPATGDNGAGTQPRAETADANDLPQGYAAIPSPTPGLDAVTLTGRPIYLGVLTLTWEQAEALPALEGVSYTAQGDTRSYLLPAADFEALVQTLNAAGTDALRQSGEDISPDASQGLVLVTGIPAPQQTATSP